MKTKNTALSLFAFTLFSGLSFAQEITIKNPLGTDRQNETVSVPSKAFDSKLLGKTIYVKDKKSGEVLRTQWIDIDGNSKPEELIFQVNISGKGKKTFQVLTDYTGKQDDRTTYSRFVPERIDDYAWENDLVAFRTYGPTAQQITESGKPGGTLTSGMDCWLKRVNYPVIDKWYRQDKEEKKSYHKDHGEGYDPYHVNSSRGTGGIGVWVNDSLFVSKNFTAYKTIANGPIRTIFELTYAPWQANGITVQEKKRISLDLGSQLSRYEVMLETSQPLPNITVGVTLHDKKGQTSIESTQGWGSYWEPIDDSELGTGVVVAKTYLPSFQDYRTSKKDLSQLYAIAHPKNNTLVYYAGYGWKKAGKFNTQKDWNNYLADFAARIQSPLEVSVK